MDATGIMTKETNSNSRQLATEGSVLALDKGGLVLKNGESLLETLNLCRASSSALFVCLGLGNAPVLDLAVVFHDSGKLSGRSLSVTGELSNSLVQRLVLLGLVFHILLLGGPGNLVLLSGCVVFCLSI